MKKAFTLIELIIVIGILGILAAVVIPIYQSQAQKAKEATAKDHLRTIRTLIEIYAAKNDVPPGYPDNDITQVPLAVKFTEQLTLAADNGDEFRGSMFKFPQNPFNNKATVKIISNGVNFPSAPNQTSTFGWIYKPFTKTIRLNTSGVDSESVAYFEY